MVTVNSVVGFLAEEKNHTIDGDLNSHKNHRKKNIPFFM